MFLYHKIHKIFNVELIAFILFLVIASCNTRQSDINTNSQISKSDSITITGSDSSNHRSNKSVIVHESDTVLQIRLDTFSDAALPEVIDGGSCRFYLSEKDKLVNKYIYIDNYAIAYISLNGTFRKFKVVEKEENENVLHFTDSLFDLKVELLKEVKKGYEESHYEGILKLYKKDSFIYKANIIGYCGE